MDKKNVSALIAGVGIAGAFGYRVYSQYKLLKKENAEKEAEAQSQEAEPEISKEESDQFDLNSLFEEHEQETESEDVDMTNLEASVEGSNEQSENVVELHAKETVESPVVEVESVVEQKEDTAFNEANQEYKELDPNDPKLWENFASEIKNESDEK